MTNDYINKALRTLSPHFFEEGVSKDLLIQYGKDFLWCADRLDNVKKKLFYDKGPALKTNLSDETIGTEYEQKQINLIHGILGLITEASELWEPLYDIITGKDQEMIDDKIRDELGDFMWYLAVICSALDSTFESVQNENIAKLQQRFPDKFESEAAINKDVAKEDAARNA